MSWVRVDDVAHEHPKLMSAGASAAWLWLCGLAYCNRQKARDGFIPEAKVKLLFPGLGSKEAKRLVLAGLWEPIDGGYIIHDYCDYQRMHGVDPELSDKRAAAGRVGGKHSAEARAKQNVEANEANAEATVEQTSEASLLSRAPTRASHPIPSHPIPSQPEREPASPVRARKAARLAPVSRPWPEDFVPDESCRQVAHVARIQLDPELLKARDWALSKGHRCKDWQAFLRNWLRRAADNPNTQRQQGQLGLAAQVPSQADVDRMLGKAVS